MKTWPWLWFVWTLLACSCLLTGCLAFVIEHAHKYRLTPEYPPEADIEQSDLPDKFVLDYLTLPSSDEDYPRTSSIDAEQQRTFSRPLPHAPSSRNVRQKRPSGILGLDNQDFIAKTLDNYNRARETSSWSRRVRVRPLPQDTDSRSNGRMSTGMSVLDLRRVMNGMKQLQTAGKRR